ncbi:MAG: M23 family metallopeptidase [Clostridia bacterium]|nr:M23 family metallopeptidase [Clostridia bacterium]
MNFFKKIFIIIIFISLFFIQKNHSSTYFSYPTDYIQISSSYGYRNIFNSVYFHNGIDFLAPQSSKIYACSNGIVIECGFSNSYGNSIILQHSNGYRSLYGHLDEKFIVNIGDYVNTSDHIGNVGPKYLSSGVLNGITTGPHLHFTIFDENNNPIDPLPLLKKNSTI